MHAPVELADIAADVLARIRDRAPRVHCITDSVAQQYTANVLLAAGAVPSMTIAAEEIGAFVGGADALLVNLGTLDMERKSAIAVALHAATDKPWLLDPVFIERSPARAEFARQLLGRGPAVVRLNQAEFAALSVDPAADAAARFAQAHRTVIALTGDVDLVVDGERCTTIANGDPADGVRHRHGLCRLGAHLRRARGRGRSLAGARSRRWRPSASPAKSRRRTRAGPGSFAYAIIDALHELDRAALRARLKVS